MGVKKDLLIGAAAGFLTGIFVIPVLINIQAVSGLPLLAGMPVALAFLFSFGVWLGRFLSRWFPFMHQFGKFAAVGFLNFSIDFGVLNLLIFVSGFNAGLAFSAFKALSFLAANVNSYLWNKFWTFRAGGEGNYAGEYSRFLTVSLVGLGINVGIASLVVNLIGPQFGIGPTLWANLGAVAGAALGLVWNFVGYKFIVFRKVEADQRR